MSIKLSKKQLLRMAERLDAIQCPSGNVYTYENVIYGIERINLDVGWRVTVPDLTKSEPINRLMEYLEDLVLGCNAEMVRCKQIAYSAGTYGNTGQLHAIQLWRDGVVITTEFIYY